MTGNTNMVRQLVELIGDVKLVEIEVGDAGFAFGKLAKRVAAKSVRLARMILLQAIRNAMADDLKSGFMDSGNSGD